MYCYLYKIGSVLVIGNESFFYFFYRDGGVIVGIVIGVFFLLGLYKYCVDSIRYRY